MLADISPQKNVCSQRTFVDASEGIKQYIIVIAGLLFFMAIGVHSIVGLLKQAEVIITHNLPILFLLSITMLLPIFFLGAMFAMKKKYGLYRKIVMDDSGMTFFSLRKKNYIRWTDIKSLGIHDSFLLNFLGLARGKTKMAEVKVDGLKYYFPLSMKEEGKEFPALYRLFSLIDENYNVINEIRPEDCPLYVEIQNHLKQKEV